MARYLGQERCLLNLHWNNERPFRKSVASRSTLRAASSASAQTSSRVLESGAVSVQGTSRKRNEDRYTVQLDGGRYSYIGVFDGHGGEATSDWLQSNFGTYIDKAWQDGNAATMAITDAFVEADKKLLAPKLGFFGALGERGVGGSKCGATGVIALLYSANSRTKLLSANVGDSRALICQNGRAEQLTVDHVPDLEDERMRIEAQNPNPKAPLVRYVAGTWRVGGILALSRAFGDAYMKGSLQFEGPNTAGSEGYSAGFGVIAVPKVTETNLEGDAWLVLASDGLFQNEERGGGGGLSNEAIAGYLSKNANRASAEELAQGLADQAQAAGSTDDITVVLLKVSSS